MVRHCRIYPRPQGEAMTLRELAEEIFLDILPAYRKPGRKIPKEELELIEMRINNFVNAKIEEVAKIAEEMEWRSNAEIARNIRAEALKSAKKAVERHLKTTTPEGEHGGEKK